MANVLSNSYLRPVYFPAGTINGQKLFRRAPFDVMVIRGVPHIQPRNIGIADSALNILGKDNLENRMNWREADFAYESLEPIIIEEHVLGDGSNSWIGLNSIGNL